MANKPASRLGDLSSGGKHAATGSLNVFVNNLKSIRITDVWTAPPVTSIQGSQTVFANNLQMVRIGDLLSDQETSAQGSNNVFIGDKRLKWNEGLFPMTDIRSEIPWADI